MHVLEGDWAWLPMRNRRREAMVTERKEACVEGERGLPGSWERKWSVFIRLGPSFKSTVTGSDGYFWMVTMAALCRISV